MLLDDGLIETNGLFVLVLLHEEHMSHVQFPRVVLIAELHRLAEDLLHHAVVLPVPVDLCLRHEYRNVPGEEGWTV